MQRTQPARGSATARHLLIAGKIALSAGLIYYAFSKIDLAEAWLQIRSISSYAVIASAALLFLEMCIAAFRLRQILAMVGPRCGFVQVVDVVFIGAFFSQTLISFVGGDAMRIWRIVRSNVSLGLAAKGVVFDRMTGLAGLLTLILLTLPFLLDLVTDPAMRLGLLAALIAGVAGFVMLALLKHLPASLKQLKPFHWVADLAVVAISVARSKERLASLLGLSLLINVANVIILYVIALGLSIELAFWHSLLLIPPVLFLAMLPISFAGWGVREGAMIVALGLVGVTPAQSVALSVCFGLSVLAISLPGGFLWLLHRGQAAPAQGKLTGETAGSHARGPES